MPRKDTGASRDVLSSDLPEALISQGRYWATSAELRTMSGSSQSALSGLLTRLRHQDRVISPARGFHVMVPPEYRKPGAPPGEWFIDPMMRHLQRAYYVSFLTAAAMHGAAHQAPQSFQVITDKYLPDRDFGRIRLRFTTSAHVTDMGSEKQITHTGYFSLATRETSIVDLVWHQRDGGGISNVATVLKEIGELDGDKIARLAPTRGRSTARRLGWLLERYRPDIDTHWLHLVAAPEAGEPAYLSPSSPKRGQEDKRWGLHVNTPVEPDLMSAEPRHPSNPSWTRYDGSG